MSIQSVKTLFALTAAMLTCLVMSSQASAEIGITSFDQTVGGTQAGATGDFGFNYVLDVAAGDVSGTIKDQVIDLPKGFIADPTVLGTCDSADIFYRSPNRCDKSAAAGMVRFRVMNPAGAGNPLPQLYTTRLWRVTSFNDEAAAFMMTAIGNYPIRFSTTVGPDSDYRVRVTSNNMQSTLPVRDVEATLWGVPADLQGDGPVAELPVTGGTFGAPLAGAPRERFAAVPTRCDVNPTSSLSVASWQNRVFLPPVFASTAAPVGCEALVFRPALTVKPSVSQAARPSGYQVVLDLAQTDELDLPRTPNLKDAEVRMPAGVVLSPSAANGLKACTDAELGFDSSDPNNCPPASKIGEVKIQTPVLDVPVTGSVYAGSQLSGDPESGDMFRIFVTAASPGVMVKLRGQVVVDRKTGRITARFLDNPDLPFERMTLTFKDGQRAPLVNPRECGNFSTGGTFTSWAGQVAGSETNIKIDGDCGQRRFSPAMKAGSADPSAAGSTNVAIGFSRDDGDQELKSLREIQLPEGLLGKVASVPLCADTDANAGTCPERSRVGRVELSAGPGSNPVWLPQAGKAPTGVYLTGPYRGAPYGLAIKVPAQAGPFDLGTVVVRSALRIDERTTQVTTGVDEARLIDNDGSVTEVLPGELPRILKGVTIDQREIRVIVDRDGFMVNPTDCSQKQIAAQAVSAQGQVANLASRFRAADCARLDFSPRIGAKKNGSSELVLSGSAKRGGNPALHAVVTMPGGGANIARASVALPHSAFLDQSHIRTICTRVQFAAGNGHGSNCPEGSIYGHVRATSPLLDYALEGNVYLRSSDNPLPDLVPVLEGPAGKPLAIVLVGRIDSKNGGIRTTFEGIPDAAVSKFTLDMRGGKKGLIVNSRDLCGSVARATAVFHGQNGKRVTMRPVVRPHCPKTRKASKKHGARKRHMKG